MYNYLSSYFRFWELVVILTLLLSLFVEVNIGHTMHIHIFIICWSPMAVSVLHSFLCLSACLCNSHVVSRASMFVLFRSSGLAQGLSQVIFLALSTAFFMYWSRNKISRSFHFLKLFTFEISAFHFPFCFIIS